MPKNTQAREKIDSKVDRQNYPAVAVIVVHYCKIEETLRCLDSLQRLNYPNFTAIVIDSSSPDGSGEILKRFCEEQNLRIIISPENRGFAGSNNIGIRYALARGTQFVWLLNPDTTVDKDALLTLVNESTEFPDAAAFGSKILYGSNNQEGQQPKIWSAGARIDFAHQQIAMNGCEEVDCGQHDQPQQCDYLPGCSLLFRSKTISQVGYLPEDYFMYFEETDWCTRIIRSGSTLRVVPQSIVYHHFDRDKLQTPFNVYYYNRNARRFWFRYGSLKAKAKIILKTLLLDLPQARRALRHAKSEPDCAIFRAHLKSCYDFLLFRRGKQF